jgi:hypothetical protein
MKNYVRLLALFLSLFCGTIVDAYAEDAVEFCAGDSANCCPGIPVDLCPSKCILNICQRGKSPGEKCVSNSHCSSGYCQFSSGTGGFEGTCQEIHSSPTPVSCKDTRACGCGPEHYCAEGECRDDSAKCVSLKPLDSPCRDDGQCETHSCYKNKCTLPITPGARCGPGYGLCGAGTFCDEDLHDPVCIPKIAPGERCRKDRHCKSGACFNGRCGQCDERGECFGARENGRDCSSSTECKSGWCEKDPNHHGGTIGICRAMPVSSGTAVSDHAAKESLVGSTGPGW